MESPQFVGKLLLGTVLVKTLNLLRAVTPGGLNDANDLSLSVAKKGVRVFDPVSSLRQYVLSDPESGSLGVSGPVVDVDGC